MKLYRFLMILLFTGISIGIMGKSRQRSVKNRRHNNNRPREHNYRGDYGYGGYPYISSPYFYPGPASWWGPGLWGYGDYYQNYDYGYYGCGPSFNIGFNFGCGC